MKISISTTLDYKSIATHFVHSRFLGTEVGISLLGELTSELDGYLAQRELLSMTDKLGHHIGWKIGATNVGAQEALKFGPFYGPLFQSTLNAAGGKVSISSLGTSFKAAEVEFAFIMSGDLPLRLDGLDYTEDEVFSRVASVTCSIELAASRITGALNPGIILADFALHGCLALGDPCVVPDSAILERVQACLELNGNQIALSTGANVLGNPLTALTWLANRLNKDGYMLKEGHIVMSGAAAASKEVVPGILTAKFIGLGPNGDDSSQLCLEITL